MAKRKPTTSAKKPTADLEPPAPQPVQDLWEKTAWICLHLLVLLVPLAMSNLGPFSRNGIPLTYDQFDIVKVFLQRALLLVAASAWLIGLLLRGGRVRFTRGEWLLLAFIAWVALTTVLSVHPPTALFGKYRRFEGLLSFITYGVGFFMALQLADRAEKMRSLARTLAIGGFLVAFYGAIQVVGTVGIGPARILLPVSIGLTVLVPAALAYWALKRAEDRETRMACWLGAAIAFLGGVVFSAGLAQNIDIAVLKGSEAVSIDPVLWGTLGFESNRAFSTFGNPDLLGGYLILSFAISLGLALSEKHPLWRSVYWSFTLLNVFVGITSYVRGAWIGATVALLLMVVAYFRARKGTTMRLTQVDWTFVGGTALLAVAVIVASSLSPHPVLNVFTRIASIFDFTEGSGGMRLEIWKATIEAIKQRPIFGWGADTTRLLFPMFKTPEYVGIAGYLSVADNVHNYPLQLASGIGIPGVLLFYGLAIAALSLAARMAFASGTAGRNLLLSGFWAAVLGYAVHLMFGLSVTGSTVIMWVAMGVLLVPSSRVREVSAPAWGRIGVGVVIVLLAVGTYFNTRYLSADMHYLSGKASSQMLERIEEIERAIELNPYNETYRLGLADAWRSVFSQVLQQYSQTTSDGSGGDAQLRQQGLDLYARTTDAYRDVIEYAPLEYDSYVFLANTHNEAATYLDVAYAERGVAAAEEAVRVQKYGPAARVQLAMALLLQDRVDDAISELEFATDLDPAYRQAHVLLAKAYSRAGRYDEARTVLEYVLSIYPDDPDALQGLAAVEASAAAAAQGQ